MRLEKEWKNFAGARVAIGDFIKPTAAGFVFAMPLKNGALESPAKIRGGRVHSRAMVRGMTVDDLVRSGAHVFTRERHAKDYAVTAAGFTWRLVPSEEGRASATEKRIAALDLAGVPIRAIAKRLDISYQYVGEILSKPARHFGNPQTWPAIESRHAS